MSKIIKGLITAGAVLFVSGACFMAVSGMGASGSGSLVDKTTELGSIDELDIDMSSEDVFIYLGNENSVHYIAYDDKIPEISEKGGKLTVREPHSKSWFHFNRNADTRVEITIDKEELRDSEISSSSGDIVIRGVNFGGKVKASSGDISISRTSNTKDIQLETSSGEIFIEECKFGSLVSTQSSGDITINDIKADSISLETSSGEIKTEDTDTDSLKLKASSGDVSVELTGGKEDYNYDLSVSSGDMKIDGSKKDGRSFTEDNSAAKKVTAETSSGDITISFS